VLAKQLPWKGMSCYASERASDHHRHRSIVHFRKALVVRTLLIAADGLSRSRLGAWGHALVLSRPRRLGRDRADKVHISLGVSDTLSPLLLLTWRAELPRRSDSKSRPTGVAALI